VSIEQRLSKVLKDKAVTMTSPAAMPTTVRAGYRRRISLHVVLAVTVLAVVGSASVFAISAFLTGSEQQFVLREALVPPGKVVHTTGLWKGTAETSVEGHRVRVELLVEPGETPDDPLIAILVNRGEQPVGYGYGYTLYRQVNGSWERVENHLVVELPELTVNSGERSEPEEILFSPKSFVGPLKPLPPGQYRVTKRARPFKSGPWNSGNRPPSFDVSARFVVSEPPAGAEQKELTFPVLEKTNSMMQALLRGTLVEREGCLYIGSKNGEDGQSPLWPHGFSYYRDENVITILDEEGNPVARTGEEVSMGGGLIGEPESPLSDELKEKVGDCEGPYWVVGEIE
jgi:hypothetical protein